MRKGLLYSATRTRASQYAEKHAARFLFARRSPARLLAASKDLNLTKRRFSTSQNNETQATAETSALPVPTYGELINLYDETAKSSRIIKLSRGQNLSYDFGIVTPEQIISVGWGGLLNVNPVGGYTKSKKYRVLKPSLEEYTLKLERHLTPIYPKDHGTIINMLDIRNGDNLLEAGAGTGLMSLALARNVGPTGSVTSYEIRKDHFDFAVKSASGWDPNHRVKFVLGDVLSCPDSNFDGLLLDVPEPTPFLEALHTKVKPGRSVVCVVPNVLHIVDFVNTIQSKNLNLLTKRIVEVSEREWTVAPAPRKTSRPNSIASIGHTAFICHFVVLSNQVVQYERPPSRNQEFRDRAAKEQSQSSKEQEISPKVPQEEPTTS